MDPGHLDRIGAIQLRRIRLVLGLRQADVSEGTGIPIGKVSLAERGVAQLTTTEARALQIFLSNRWRLMQQLSGAEQEKLR